MKIVTGYTGSPHVTSNDEQGKNQGIFGAGNCVLNVGNRFNATLTNANTVTIEDGEGVMQGVHFRIEPGTTETVNIQNGTSGYKRIDLICARYTKNAVTGVEAVNLVVITGTPSSSTPAEPAYTQDDILSGATQADFPLWKVTLNGLTPTLQELPTLWKRPVLFFNEAVGASIASNAGYEVNFTLPQGVWLVHIDFGLTYASGSVTIGDHLQIDGPGGIHQVIYAVSGQIDVYGNYMGFCVKTNDEENSVYVANLSSKSATLETMNVMAVQLA